jgi:hypothetical protein
MDGKHDSLHKSGQNENSYKSDQRKSGEGRSPSIRIKSDRDRRGSTMRGKQLCYNAVETAIN